MKTVCIFDHKGGVGKSTTAGAIAPSFEQEAVIAISATAASVLKMFFIAEKFEVS